MGQELDPVQYEIFRHRLYNILEEGRIAMAKVSGSPVVVEGGECMTSFYDAEGNVILTACGVLLHTTGAADFIKKSLEWYGKDPGIYEGDQIFWNDPYIGATHASDMAVMKPIFYKGKLIAWTGCMMHTDDTGGVGPGGQKATATEVFHEGIRIRGLKVMEKGQFRKDVFTTITEQVRDPHFVGLDIKARIASNNVCSRAYLGLVEKYGIDFVEAASHKIVADSDKMSRAKLRELPDGIWRSRVYGHDPDHETKPFKVECTMIKEGEEITFDLTGSSPDIGGSLNSAYPNTWSGLFCVLASQLFWDVPWNYGMVAPVKLIAPEGTIVNCRFPRASSNGVIGGGWMVTSAAHECIAKMVFAGGDLDDVNSGWSGLPGGSLRQYGGKNQHGGQVGAVIFDSFAGGTGAGPSHDGEDSGALMMNPQSRISDCEITEMNYPFLYIGRNNCADTGGFGKFRGGDCPDRVFMIHGSDSMTTGYYGFGAVWGITGGIGIYGGYPHGLQYARLVVNTDLGERLQRSDYPTTLEEIEKTNCEIVAPERSFVDRPVKQTDLLYDVFAGGCGYGDPLDRDPEAVLRDVRGLHVSLTNAGKMYGVVIDSQAMELDLAATEELRKKQREERLRQGVPLKGQKPKVAGALVSASN